MRDRLLREIQHYADSAHRSELRMDWLSFANGVVIVGGTRSSGFTRILMSRLLQKPLVALREGGLLLLLSKASRLVVDRLSLIPARMALKNALDAADRLDDYVDTIYEFRYRGISIAPSQIRSEIQALLEVLAESPPRVVLEIGTGLGGTTLLLARVAANDGIVVTIDLPIGPSRQRLLDAGCREGQKIHAIRADSHQRATVDRVESILGGEQIDVLFIDGDHSYEGVQTDFQLYSGLVRRGGWIGFHDIMAGPEEFVGGVPEFWRRLKRDREAREFVHDRSQRGLGIGLIRAVPGVAGTPITAHERSAPDR